MLDLKIINGQVADLAANRLVQESVGIRDGIIVARGAAADAEEAKETIDASGHVVSPGFIDIHMHEENYGLVPEGEWDIASCMLRMGVTTAVIGNCGSNRQYPGEVEERIGRLGNPVNYMAFIGHNFLRDLVGSRDTQAASTPEQIEQMALMVKEEIDKGAIGISYGIEYATGMTFEEMVGICKYVTGRKDLLLAAHYREDASGALPSITEMCEISRVTGIPFQISHLSSCSAFGNMREALDLIHKYREEGLDVLADAYPYAAFSTAIGSDVFLPGCLEHWGADYPDVEMTEAPYENVRCTKEIFDDARQNYPEMYAIAHVMKEEEIAMALADPLVMPASDGIYRHHKGHPRGAGTFPRYLGKYVREEGLADLITGIRKCTEMPAQRLRLGDRKGRIEEGFDADITIFDPETIIDRAVFGDGQLPPEGIDYVIVNGRIALRGTEIVDYGCGKYIRRP
ncbi:MAG: amidohydrolase family protein [Firmicutes bacterium]|nr:amidohydrolase family protein [Bacillota bacterium]